MDTATDTVEDFSPRPAKRMVVTIAETGQTLYVPFEMFGPWSTNEEGDDGNSSISYTLGEQVVYHKVTETAEQINDQYDRAMEVHA